MRREAVVAAPRGEAEEPGRMDDADAVDADGSRPPVEPVEPLLRADEAWVGWTRHDRIIAERRTAGAAASAKRSSPARQGCPPPKAGIKP